MKSLSAFWKGETSYGNSDNRWSNRRSGSQRHIAGCCYGSRYQNPNTLLSSGSKSKGQLSNFGVVEVEGLRVLPGLFYTGKRRHGGKNTLQTGSQGARKNILELIFCSPFKGCLQCDKNGTCELQPVAQDLQFINFYVSVGDSKGNGEKRIFLSIHYQGYLKMY